MGSHGLAWAGVALFALTSNPPAGCELRQGQMFQAGVSPAWNINWSNASSFQAKVWVALLRLAGWKLEPVGA